ncbi:MAG: hypothetical protein ABUS79_00690 [Pseudomonadota bacterium]
MGTFAATGIAVVAAASASGCRRMGDDYEGQIASAVGEVMAGADESVQGGTATAMGAGVPVPTLRTPDELRGPLWRRALGAIVPEAHAASCWPATLSACTGGVRTRTFESCTIGRSTLEGSVTFTFSRPMVCAAVTAGDTVTRAAAFTLTGPYGGTLEVTSPGGGQTLTRTAAGFDYSVGGMQRVLTGPGGKKLFDVSTRTTTPITVTGTSRADLVIASGALEITHNLAGYKVTLVPRNLAWSASCNCAVSGSLTGTVSGGSADGKSASVELTGCGQANVTIDGDTESVTLDRCAAI